MFIAPLRVFPLPVLTTKDEGVLRSTVMILEEIVSDASFFEKRTMVEYLISLVILVIPKQSIRRRNTSVE